MKLFQSSIYLSDNNVGNTHFTDPSHRIKTNDFSPSIDTGHGGQRCMSRLSTPSQNKYSIRIFKQKFIQYLIPT